MSEIKHENVLSIPSRAGEHGPKETLPHVGKPLDGSQYLNVIEEQIYSELPPTPEEEQPIRARHLEDSLKQKGNAQGLDPTLSVGPP